MRGRVLVVAGSDSGGGAGIQADIKTVTALGGFAMTAVTAITVQDTTGVHAVHAVPADIVRGQIACVLADIGADAVKTGMLGDAATVRLVEAALAGVAAPVVVDPVMVAKGGARLLDAAALDALRSFLRRAAVVTPNLPEAAALTGRPVADVAAMREAARDLLAMGAAAALVKGGHLDGEEIVDVLADAGGVREFRGTRIAGRSTHGTGCTLASAVATGLAQGMKLAEAVARARLYVRAAIAAAPGYGHGHGPMDHGVTMDPARIGAPA